jgi:PAS domain S-box-containing protein
VSVGDSAQRRWALANSEPLLDPRTGEVRAAVVTFADITALIGAEHEARQRAAELDAVIDSIADGVIIHDRAHRVVRVNDMAKQILQVADEDLQADRAEVVAHVRPHRADGTALPTAEMPSERALHGEIVLGVILTVESREGERTWISESAAPLRDAGGEITGAVATFTDITAQVLGRQRFEELAREAEMRAAEVSTVIDTMVDGVTISDAEGGIVRYNDAARRLLCYETWHESVPYSERLERCQYRRPDGAEFAFEDLPLSRSLRGERVVGETIRMVWPDGTSTWVNSSSAPLCDGEGNVAGAVLTTVDITEQVESRRRIEELGAQSQASLAQLEAVVNSMSEGVVTTDATGMIVDMNPVALRMHGFETVEECRRTIAQYAEFLEVERLDGTPVPPEDFPLARALRGEPNDEATLRWRRTDTGLTWIGVFSYSSIRDADGRIIMTMNTIRDVTAEVEAEHRREQHLQRQAKLLEISQRLLAEHTASGVYQVVVDGARELTGAKLATSGQSFEDGTYRIGSSSRAEGMPPCLQFEVFDMARGGVYTELLETQTSLRLTQEELEAHPRWWGLPEGHAPLRGLLGATIAHGGYGAASGLILLSDKAGDADFTEEDEAAITQLAALASLGLRHIQVRDEAERRAEELDAVIGSMNEGVVVFGQEGVIARANTAAAAVCGFDPTGMDAASLASRLGLRDEAGSFVDVDGLPGVRAIQGERIAGEPYTFVSSESRKTRVLISASPLVVGGRSAGSVAIWHDVTEREALLQQLDQERRLLDAIVAQMPAGLIVAEAPSGRLILQNRQMEAIWGGDPGRAAVTWHGLRLGSGHASGHELRPEEWPLTRTLLTGEMVRHAEINITRLDGSSAVVSCNAGPVHDQDGYVIAGVAIFHDITQSKRVEAALRESEAQMRAVVENMPVMVTAFGRDHADRVAWNRECERVTGYSAEEILGNPRSNELLYPDPGYREIRVRDLQERGHHYRGWEWDVTCKDGTVRTIAWSDISEQVPIPGWSSWSIGVDVTDRRRAEDAERLAAVGQLSAGVAHEFNNLLAVMLLQAELAGETRDVEQYETLVAVVMEAAEQGSGICRDMSLFARPGAPSRYPVQIEEVIDSALNLAGRQVENSGVVVTRDHQAAGRRVYGDPKQLGQVFLNLIINACHAMPRGGDLSVSTRYVQTGSGSGNVVIQISDTGTGITPEHLRRIFEPFFTTKGRLGDSDTPGTGLGLSVSHGIVTAHGGMIEVRSEVGVGTTFEVALPVYEEDAAELASPECAGAPPQSRCCSVQVLVVEDVGVMASLIQTVLTASGHEATCVSDTRAAIASLTACRFDLVVTDLLMPGGGGQEVLTFASTLDDPVPVLVVTGVVGEQMEREAMAMGAAGYVRKPFTRAELIGAVEKILQERGMG